MSFVATIQHAGLEISHYYSIVWHSVCTLVHVCPFLGQQNERLFSFHYMCSYLHFRKSSEIALARAKQNVEHSYFVVAIDDNIKGSSQIFEYMFPLHFYNATNIYKHLEKHKGNSVISIKHVVNYH